jgi:hypothetical protein
VYRNYFDFAQVLRLFKTKFLFLLHFGLKLATVLDHPKRSQQMTKILNKTMLFILVTLYAICTGLTVYAEPDTPGENKAPTGLLGWTHLEGEKGFHLDFGASGSYGPISGYTKLLSEECHLRPVTNDQNLMNWV